MHSLFCHHQWCNIKIIYKMCRQLLWCVPLINWFPCCTEDKQTWYICWCTSRVNWLPYVQALHAVMIIILHFMFNAFIFAVICILVPIVNCKSTTNNPINMTGQWYVCLAHAQTVNHWYVIRSCIGLPKNYRPKFTSTVSTLYCVFFLHCIKAL